MSDIIIQNMPLDTAETIYARLSPFLKKYHKVKEVEATVYKSSPVEYTMKDLLISSYTQGLLDAVQLYESGKLEELKVRS